MRLFAFFYPLPLQGVLFLEKFLKSGFTTGTCVAAATKAALLAHKGSYLNTVNIQALSGEILSIPIEHVEKKSENEIFAAVRKDSGDDPDITNGMIIEVKVLISAQHKDIIIKAGTGVGIVTSPGLAAKVGQPAVNPGPRKMITNVVKEILKEEYGCEITIIIPRGVELAKKTLNPILGIEGGLSIIGTSGIVRPMSEEAFKDSLAPQIDVAKAKGLDTLIFVPGKIGYDACIDNFGVRADAIVQTSNFIGFMLESAAERKIQNILFVGHLGKLIKVAGGIFHTHNRVADARLEILAVYAASLGASTGVVRDILSTTTTEAAIEILEENHIEGIYDLIAQRISYRAMRYVYNEICIGAVITSLDGTILGIDENAKKIGGVLGWNIK